MQFSKTGNRYADWAAHIIQSIDQITDVLGWPLDLDLLDSNLNTLAVERCLEIMSEAVARFSRADVPLSTYEPSIPWREVRAFGNVIRHEYENLDERTVRETILLVLPDLRAAALRLRARFEAEAS